MRRVREDAWKTVCSRALFPVPSGGADVLRFRFVRLSNTSAPTALPPSPVFSLLHAANFTEEHWRPACESIGVPLQPWPENLETLSMCFAVGPIGSRRVSRIAVDVDPQNAVVFNNGQLGNFINQLGIGLTVNQGLNDQEASISKLGTQLKTDETAQIAFVNEARFHVGLYFLIERYSDMIYHAKPEELKLGRHLIHGFLRSLVHEFSARTKALIERSHNWLKESKSARGRANAVVIVLAVMYGLCARQSNLNHRGYLVCAPWCPKKKFAVTDKSLRIFQ